jgi:hypothetical protein
MFRCSSNNSNTGEGLVDFDSHRTLGLEYDGKAINVTFNRPEAMNAFARTWKRSAGGGGWKARTIQRPMS